MTNAIVEMPAYSYLKYEAVKVSNATFSLRLDRILNVPVPYEYGFIPNTLCGDGDPLDVFIHTSTYIPILPLTIMNVEVLGVIRGIDNGKQDDKILAFFDDPAINKDALFDEMKTKCIEYLETYKKGFEVQEVLREQDALEVIKETETLFVMVDF